MKNLLTTILITLISLSSVKGKVIRNGYEFELNKIRTSIENINVLISQEKTLENKSGVRKLKKYLNQILKLQNSNLRYYKITNDMINELSKIDPVLFNEINSITDRNGNATDVYVKVVPLNWDQEIFGTTIIRHCKNNPHVCTSSYGDKTVSVEIINYHKSLILLAHEFGHVKYLVPNLAKYESYYLQTYLTTGKKMESKGHSKTDPCGKAADLAALAFQKKLLEFNHELKIQDKDKLAVNQTGHKKGARIR